MTMRRITPIGMMNSIFFCILRVDVKRRERA